MEEGFKEAVEIIEAVSRDDPEDTRVPVSYAVLKATPCKDGGEHRLWVGMTGDCWATSCSNCGMVSDEYDPDTNWDNF